MSKIPPALLGSPNALSQKIDVNNNKKRKPRQALSPSTTEAPQLPPTMRGLPLCHLAAASEACPLWSLPLPAVRCPVLGRARTRCQVQHCRPTCLRPVYMVLEWGGGEGRAATSGYACLSRTIADLASPMGYEHCSPLGRGCRMATRSIIFGKRCD